MGRLRTGTVFCSGSIVGLTSKLILSTLAFPSGTAIPVPVPVSATSSDPLISHHFYVSSSRGSDSAVGTDPAHPWASFAKLAGSISEFASPSAGLSAPVDPVPAIPKSFTTTDTEFNVHLATGDVWHESLEIVGPGSACHDTMRGFFEGISIGSGATGPDSGTKKSQGTISGEEG